MRAAPEVDVALLGRDGEGEFGQAEAVAWLAQGEAGEDGEVAALLQDGEKGVGFADDLSACGWGDARSVRVCGGLLERERYVLPARRLSHCCHQAEVICNCLKRNILKT